MEHLNHISQLHQPNRPANRFAHQQARIALPDPAFKHLKQRLMHPLTQPEPSRKLAGDDTVGRMHRLHRVAIPEQELNRRTHPLRRRPPRTQMPHRKAALVHPDQPVLVR